MYRRIIKDTFKIARLLNDDLRKDKDLDLSDSTTDALDTYPTLKYRLMEPSLFVLSTLKRPYMINTDPCVHNLGAVLFQQQNESYLRE